MRCAYFALCAWFLFGLLCVGAGVGLAVVAFCKALSLVVG
ncbi:hypothetical protein LMG7143_01129 [Ralstonia thomasii]|jgi:hypothetical protein|nr:hypothetical protein LMG7143_01119 [Ralstonia sp. LMG 18095]CAJ0709579.1 hypothetical protein LMG7143_01129 [Ralstonia sp. LMG 18095]